jgi:hypothetical protein
MLLVLMPGRRTGAGPIDTAAKNIARARASPRPGAGGTDGPMFARSLALTTCLLAACSSGRPATTDTAPLAEAPRSPGAGTATALPPATSSAATSSAATFRFGDAAVIERGRALHDTKACTPCHSVDGSPKVAPSSRGVFTRATAETQLADGQSLATLIGPGRPYPLVADYVAAKIRTPSTHPVAGYAPTMPSFDGHLAPDELEALVVFLASLDGISAPQ